ncbi:MAG: hypothetical protein IT258_16405 [Saprospiraceae bacterium]|nr:hypothetical protein [Saprospiraceae bacterium]
MENTVALNEPILRISDILEQLQDVNRMIALHRNREDKIMLKQYEYRRSKFLAELRELLYSFEVTAADLAA